MLQLKAASVGATADTTVVGSLEAQRQLAKWSLYQFICTRKCLISQVPMSAWLALTKLIRDINWRQAN